MIGEQLRTLRTANKMTQKELAGELSVAFQTISNWENNSIIDTTQLTEHQHAQLLGLAKEFSKLNKK